MYIYQAIQEDKRYIPTRKTVLKEFPTQAEAIKWLEENGGGIFRDILNNLECRISPKKQTGEF